jgi:hypothetical protein
LTLSFPRVSLSPRVLSLCPSVHQVQVESKSEQCGPPGPQFCLLRRSPTEDGSLFTPMRFFFFISVCSWCRMLHPLTGIAGVLLQPHHYQDDDAERSDSGGQGYRSRADEYLSYSFSSSSSFFIICQYPPSFYSA